MATRTEVLEAALNLNDRHVTRRFIKNVLEARENGYEDCCVYCGTGVFDGSEIHEAFCPCEGEEANDRFADQILKFAAQREP